MRLDERINKVNPNMRMLSAHLENPFSSNKEFFEFFYTPLEKIFKNKNREKEVLEFYEYSPWILPINEKNFRKVMEINSNIYRICSGINFFNSDKSICLTVNSWEKIDFKKYNSLAIRNLMAIVKDTHLSFGDKKIIKDTALESFNWMIKYATSEKGGQCYDFNHCVRTDLYEYAAYRLRDFGFKVEHPYSRIKDFELRN